MLSPHLLRPYSGSQLGLVEAGLGVLVLAAAGSRWVGPTLLVHRPTLEHRVSQSDATWVVVVGEPVPEPSTVAQIDDMLAVVTDDLDGLVATAPFTEAVKEVEGDRVVRPVDRTSLVRIRPPEVLRRSALTAALGGVEDLWVNAAHLVLAAGGTVAPYRRATSRTV